MWQRSVERTGCPDAVVEDLRVEGMSEAERPITT
jgi:hypothetical protein